MSEAPKPNGYYTYEFPTMAHAGAIEAAYLEQGIFKPPKTVEEERLHKAWSEVRPDETDGFVGTGEDMQATAALLRDWGELNLERIEERGYASTPESRLRNLRAIIARAAVDMADDMDHLVAASQQNVSPTLDMDEVYSFLDQWGDAA